MKNRNDVDIFDLITLIVFLTMLLGCIMNLQNLYEYWEDVPIMDMSAKWYTSLVGVFIPIIGAITGYIW